MSRGMNKRKKEVGERQDQPKEKKYGLITDTKYHTVSLYSWNFEQIR